MYFVLFYACRRLKSYTVEYIQNFNSCCDDILSSTKEYKKLLFHLKLVKFVF
jgi:hypothetical protein